MLSPELCQIQSMPDASPVKWHLAHTTWFFEAFILAEYDKHYSTFDSAFHYLFNSYYNSLGAQFPRAKRGMITTPNLADVLSYRIYVDKAIHQLCTAKSNNNEAKLLQLVVLGLNHEQQHQELILTDVKHALWQLPSPPAILAAQQEKTLSLDEPEPLQWRTFHKAIVEIGASQYPTDVLNTHNSHIQHFFYDNETPRHEHLLHAYQLASRTVTNGEYLDFINDGGYEAAELWLSDGWAWLQQNHIKHPLYWRQINNSWQEFHFIGYQTLNLAQPVCHVSFYEAMAYAQWANARLPTEFEWEAACASCQPTPNKQSNLLDNRQFAATPEITPFQHLLGNCWEWTRSDYAPYPGFTPLAGAVGEYNGKFMCNQYVLRGGSCATPRSHIRHTYRNFFYPHMRWQFSGIRLARNVPSNKANNPNHSSIKTTTGRSL